MESRDLRILITGANSGLGFETVKELLRRGIGEVVLACRSLEKAEQAKDKLDKIAKGKVTALGGFNMTNPQSIADSVKALSKEPFDVVFLNSGGVVFEDDFQRVRWKDQDYEKTIFQNVFGGFLTYRQLKDTGRLVDRCRVVFSGGEGARGIPGMIDMPRFGGQEDLRDYILGRFSNRSNYNPMNAIGVSKYVSALLVKGLHEDSGFNDEFIWFSPGFTKGTGGLKGLPKIQEWFMQNIVFGFMSLIGVVQSPTKGAKKNADFLMGNIGRGGELLASPKNKTTGPSVEQTPFNPEFSKVEMVDSVLKVAKNL